MSGIDLTGPILTEEAQADPEIRLEEQKLAALYVLTTMSEPEQGNAIEMIRAAVEKGRGVQIGVRVFDVWDVLDILTRWENGERVNSCKSIGAPTSSDQLAEEARAVLLHRLMNGIPKMKQGSW